MAKRSKVSSPKVISLYSGAGGLDYGFEAAGFQTTVAVERDHDSCVTLRANRPEWSVIEDDIQNVSSEQILKAGRLKKGAADVLIGGPPCQPFSKSGYWHSGDSKRLRDARADTLYEYMRVVEETLPKVVVLENVHGLSYMRKSEGLDFLLEQLRAINKKAGVNYVYKHEVLNALSYGVPQQRTRFFLVAWREGKDFTFPAATHGTLSENADLFSHGALAPCTTAWDALHDVHLTEEECAELQPAGKWAELLPSIPEGENYLFHTDRRAALGGRPLFGWRRHYWSFLLKLAKDRPSWTVQAQPGPAIGPFHWKNRRLSWKELCRLQTFPTDIEIHGSFGSRQRQVGNAVPSLLAEVIAREIRTQLLGLKPISTASKLLPTRQTKVPPPERPTAVPSQYLELIGRSTAHPGTGRGYAAAKRASSYDAQTDY